MASYRGHSSAGRAPAWHAGGQRFESAWLHLENPGQSWVFLCPNALNMGLPGRLRACRRVFGRVFDVVKTESHGRARAQ